MGYMLEVVSPPSEQSLDQVVENILDLPSLYRIGTSYCWRRSDRFGIPRD